MKKRARSLASECDSARNELGDIATTLETLRDSEEDIRADLVDALDTGHRVNWVKIIRLVCEGFQAAEQFDQVAAKGERLQALMQDMEGDIRDTEAALEALSKTK